MSSNVQDAPCNWRTRNKQHSQLNLGHYYDIEVERLANILNVYTQKYENETSFKIQDRN